MVDIGRALSRTTNKRAQPRSLRAPTPWGGHLWPPEHPPSRLQPGGAAQGTRMGPPRAENHDARLTTAPRPCGRRTRLPRAEMTRRARHPDGISARRNMTRGSRPRSGPTATARARAAHRNDARLKPAPWPNGHRARSRRDPKYTDVTCEHADNVGSWNDSVGTLWRILCEA